MNMCKAFLTKEAIIVRRRALETTSVFKDSECFREGKALCLNKAKKLTLPGRIMSDY